jgi:ABC-type multidrug transport system fused ATPase/permease subunit
VDKVTTPQDQALTVRQPHAAARLLRRAGRTLPAARARVRGIYDVVRKVIYLSREKTAFTVTFIVASVVNALTDGFTVMLVVPLVDTLASDALFRGIPLLSDFGGLFQGMDITQRLRWITLIVLVIVLLRGIMGYVVDLATYMIPLAIEQSLRNHALRLVMAARMGFVDNLSTGEISNLTASFPIRVGIAARFLAQMVSSATTAILLLGLLVTITPMVLAGLAAFTLVGSIIFKRLTGPLAITLGEELTRAQESYNQTFLQAIYNHRIVRVSDATDAILATIERLVNTLRRTQMKSLAVQSATYPFFSTIGGLFVCSLMFGVTFTRTESAQAILGVLVVFLVAMARLLGPLSVFHIARMHFVTHVDAVEKLYAFLKSAEAARDPDGSIELSNFQGRISFDHVSFAYDPGKPLLRDVSFSTRAGEMVAVVGPSGSGKTTLFRLLTRIYRPASGSISVDGHRLDDLAIASFWKRLAYVSQDILIFRGTVRENMTFGRPDAFSDAQLRQAARMAAALPFIEALDHGFDTVIGDGGITLSGGEKQRIALSRAFLHDARLVLLDEATSQLDAITERQVQDSVAQLRARGCTILVIAHRLSTVRDADRILVLDNGQVVADGTHVALVGQKGLYSEMVEKQTIRA